MAITTPKEFFVTVLSDLRHGAERMTKIYKELGQLAENPEIDEALNAREFVSRQIVSRLDECFWLIGEQPVPTAGRLHDVLIEDFRREFAEIQSPVARRLFVLAKAASMMHFRIGEHVALIAISDRMGHPAVR